jgi:phosphohistidine swiveling domain-containing protein
MTFIRTFQEIGANDVGLVGGKGANLGEMTRAGLPVPPGFCVTAEAYRAFIRDTDAGETIRRILAEAQIDDPEEVEARTARIRTFLTGQEMPAEIGAQVLESYHRHASEWADGAPLPVAVRSSATAEDLPTASFAGQQDTYLNIRGDAELLDHVKRCWASLWTARAVTYRVKQGFDHEQVALAVVVQAMIRSEVSGIMFTANPVTSSREEVVINASWGLGEAIVSGLVTPDTFTVRKSDGAIVSREIATKDLAIEYADQGSTAEQEVPADRRNLPALSDGEVATLVSLSQRIESHYRVPMDIEWGYARGEFYILQARAITTLAHEAPRTHASGEYSRSMFVEIFPDPLSPTFLSAISPLIKSFLDFTFETFGFKPPEAMEAVGVFYNQPYFRRDYIAATLRQLTPPVREAMIAQMVNPFGRQERRLRGELSPSYLGMVIRLIRFMLRFPAQLPGIVSHYREEIKAIESLRLDTMPDREIVRRIRDLVFGTASRLLNYDFLMIALIGITYQMLGSLLQRYFGEESEEVRSTLLSGVTGNVTMEGNKRIWDLAQLAKASPTVSAALRQYSSSEVRTQLEQTREGKDFLVALDRFLGEYGHREIRMDILYPTWGEDPAPVLAFVRGYLDVGESSSPHRQQERLVRQREELARDVQTRVQRDLVGRYMVWPIFRTVLKHTQAHTRQRDTMHFELTRLFPPFRRLLLELGRRWTARGILDNENEIFFLHLDEMERLAESAYPVRELVRERKSEFEANKRRAVPVIIRDGQEIYAEGAQVPSPGADTGQLRGIAGSPGRATGVARVIRGPEEFDRLQSGEILVAPLTNPVWTPLFAIAGGLVTEVGGILSHGAIVAREYGIPAVMAVAGATRILQEGQRTTVDGSKGIVFIE